MTVEEQLIRDAIRQISSIEDVFMNPQHPLFMKRFEAGNVINSL